MCNSASFSRSVFRKNESKVPVVLPPDAKPLDGPGRGEFIFKGPIDVRGLAAGDAVNSFCLACFFCRTESSKTGILNSEDLARLELDLV